jgi:hypothetical protein
MVPRAGRKNACQYAYGKENIAFGELSMADRSKLMQEDVQTVVEKVLAEHAYERIFFLGKSIGTMPIVDGLLQNPSYEKAAAILFTPILTSELLAANLLKTIQPVYLAIGTADHYYDETLIGHLQQSVLPIRTNIVPNANHSLEIGWDLQASISVLESVMSGLDGFVSKVIGED